MKIRIILIQVIVLLIMTNVFCQQNEEKIIFEDQKDRQAQNKYYYSDQLGRYIIKKNLPDYKIIEQDGKLGVLNKSGDVLINPFVKGKIEHEPNGFMIKHNNLYGFYDLEGNELLAHKYKALFLNGKYITTVVSKYGIYEVGAEQILDTLFCLIRPMFGTNKKLYQVSKDCMTYTIVDIDTLNSNLKFEYQYLRLLDIVGAYLIKKDDKFGMINYNAEEVIPLHYETLTPFQDYLIAERDRKYGIINYTNEEIIPFEYDEIKQGESNDFIVRKNGRSGTVNLNNEILIPLSYNYLRSTIEVNNGYIFKENGREGLINFEGKIILEPKYTLIKSIYERQEEDWSLISKGYILSDINGKYSISNSQGKLLSEFIYDDIKQNRGFNPYPLEVRLGEYIFKMNKWGKCIRNCPPKEIFEAAKNKR